MAWTRGGERGLASAAFSHFPRVLGQGREGGTGPGQTRARSWLPSCSPPVATQRSTLPHPVPPCVWPVPWTGPWAEGPSLGWETEPETGKDEKVWPGQNKGLPRRLGTCRDGVCVCVCWTLSRKVHFKEGVLKGQLPQWSLKEQVATPPDPQE